VSHQPAGLVALDLAAVFVFALSGGLTAVRARLDLFGVVVVATGHRCRRSARARWAC